MVKVYFTINLLLTLLLCVLVMFTAMPHQTEENIIQEVDPATAWELLTEDSNAQLVDVRTPAEWQQHGTADLSSLQKEVIFLPWREAPAMSVNPTFTETLQNQVADKDTPLLFLCRSGVRSYEAAFILAQQCGYTSCYNILYGMEGVIPEESHTNTQGWKEKNLPWKHD